MQLDYFHMCRVGFELFLLKFLGLWFKKLYQFNYIFKHFVFVLMNLVVSGVFNIKEFKLNQFSIISYVQCLLFPLSLASIDNFMLQNFIPLLFIATFHCFWIRHNFRKLTSPLFLVLSLFSFLRLFFSIPGKALFFIILAQCVLYLLVQVNQKRHVFSVYVFFSQVLVFLVSIVSTRYDSIMEFKKFHVFSRNVVFVDSIDKLFVNLFYHVVLFMFGLFLALYLLMMDQGDKFRMVNTVCCLVMFLHFLYRILHFLFLDLDNGVSNFNVLLTYVLEYNTVVFVFLCLLTTVLFFGYMAMKMKYYTDYKTRSIMRKALHFMIILFCYYGFYLRKENFLALVLALVIIGLVFIELLRINKLLFKPVSEFFTCLYRNLGHDPEVYKFEISTVTMLIGVLIPILFELRNDQFNWVGGALGVFTVGVGDSMASIVGVRYKGNRYNGKTKEGMVAFCLSCLGMMVLTSLLQHGFVYDFKKMFFISIFSSVFEYVSKEEDNISVSLFAVLLYNL